MRDRPTNRVGRYGGLPLATVQRRWDSAMTMPSASDDGGVRSNNDASTGTGATRGGAVAQGQAEAARGGAPPAADIETERARPADAVARRAVRFGTGNAKSGTGGGRRLASRQSKSSKHTEAARRSAAPATGIGSEHVPPAKTVRHALELSSFGHRVARRAERFGADDADCENGETSMTSFELELTDPEE